MAENKFLDQCQYIPTDFEILEVQGRGNIYKIGAISVYISNQLAYTLEGVVYVEKSTYEFIKFYHLLNT